MGIPVYVQTKWVMAEWQGTWPSNANRQSLAHVLSAILDAARRTELCVSASTLDDLWREDRQRYSFGDLDESPSRLTVEPGRVELVDDLGHVIHDLCGEDHECVSMFYRYTRNPPLRVYGGVQPGGSVFVCTHSDIWLPYVRAFGHPRCGDEERFVSNRDVADSNAPRLNAFIDIVRQAMLEVGGTWEVFQRVRPYADVIDDRGIVLDALPGTIVTREELGPWRDSEDEDDVED